MPFQQIGSFETPRSDVMFQKEPVGSSFQQVRYILWVGAAIFLFSALGSCSRITMIQSMYGVWAQTGLIWFLLLLDLACGVLALYAAARLARGDVNIARIMLIIMMVVGGIGAFVSLGFRAILNLILGIALMVAGFRGRQLLTQEKQLRR